MRWQWLCLAYVFSQASAVRATGIEELIAQCLALNASNKARFSGMQATIPQLLFPEIHFRDLLGAANHRRIDKDSGRVSYDASTAVQASLRFAAALKAEDFKEYPRFAVVREQAIDKAMKFIVAESQRVDPEDTWKFVRATTRQGETIFFGHYGYFISVHPVTAQIIYGHDPNLPNTHSLEYPLEIRPESVISRFP